MFTPEKQMGIINRVRSQPRKRIGVREPNVGFNVMAMLLVFIMNGLV